jgi:hypothetical protein
MLAIFNIVFPIFSLIFLGWICRKRRILSAGAASELNRFVIWLALPALLFDSMSRLKPADFANLRFIAVFAIGVAVVFLVTAALRLRQKAAAPDVIIDSLGSSYANTGFIGIPLCYLAFGSDGLPPSVIAMVMTACLLFAVAIVLLETCLHAQAAFGQTVAKVGRSLLRNPIMIAPVAGIIVALSGVAIPLAYSSSSRSWAGRPDLARWSRWDCSWPSRCARRLAGVAAGGLQAAAAAGRDRRAGLLDPAHAAPVGRQRSAAGGAAHRHRALHAGRAVPARSHRHVARHPLLHHPLAADHRAHPGLDCASLSRI